tara:strand:- start:29325 stop:30167 length:843 start_codon:yes stop_codon:yes gene_type:complete
MTFFNKKEDVIDIKLTQFGKDLLARGYFKPVFYRFFDDDILYNKEYVGEDEDQNDVEKRILEQTVKLKTQHLTYPVHAKYKLETEKIYSGESEVFKRIVKNADPSMQERILLYPLHEYDVQSESAPAFNVRSFGTPFKEGVTFLHLTGAGITKKIPQINVNPEYKIRKDERLKGTKTLVDEQSFIDLMSKEITFSDNTKIIVESDDFIIDMEEVNSFFGLDNFELEIFEVLETDGKDDTLVKLTSKEEIDKYFEIKTDEDVEEVEVKTARQRNYYKRGEV